MSVTRFRGWMAAILLAISALSFAQQATPNNTAAIVTLPPMVRISGTVTDPSARKNGVAGVIFSLYSSEGSSSALWSETQSVRFDASGRYSVLLGANSAEGVPLDLFASGEAKWLGASIDGREQPRMQLVSVPYAFKAQDAQTVNGMTAAQIAAQAAAMVPPANTTAPPSGGSKTNIQSSSMVNAQITNTSSLATDFVDTNASQVVSVTQNGTGRALTATTGSTTESAIYGVNTSTTGTIRTIYGESNSTTNSSAGVYGISKGTTGTVYGVLGLTSSTSGIALNGTAIATTGSTTGLRGQANSISGVGVQGAATAGSGATVGVNGFVLSPAGFAGVFDNRAGGKILSLRNNAVEKLSVDGSGNLSTVGSVTGVTFSGSGASLTGLNATQLTTGTVPDARLSGSYSGALSFTNAANSFTGAHASLADNANDCAGSTFHLGVTPPSSTFCGAVTADSTASGVAALAGLSVDTGVRGHTSGNNFGVYASTNSAATGGAALYAYSNSANAPGAIVENSNGGKVASFKGTSGEVVSVANNGDIATTGSIVYNTAPMMLFEHASFANTQNSLLGSGSLTAYDGLVDMNTGASVSSSVDVTNQNSFILSRGLDKSGAFLSARMRLRAGTFDANVTTYLMAGAATLGFGFRVDGAALKGISADSGGTTVVDLGTTLTVGSASTNFYDFMAVHRSNSVEFYVNGVLKGTSTTNINIGTPASTYEIYIANGATASNQEVQVGLLTVGIPMN